MQNKFDLGSGMLIITFILAMFLLIYFACTHFVNAFIYRSANSTMYSRPTWPDPPETTITETTEEVEESEETEEDYKDYEDEEYDDYEE